MIKAKTLRKCILRDAVMGKMSHQKPEDSNARDEVKEAVIGEYSNEEKIPFEIPDNWCWARLGEVAEVISGQSPEGRAINKTDGIEFHQGKIAFGVKYIGQSEFKTRKPTKIAPAGSVLLSVRAPVGNVNLTDRDICIGRGLATFRCKGTINKDYFYCVMLAYEHIFKAQGRGTTFDGITARMIRRQIIPIPPMPEQLRIVSRLEPILQTLDDLADHQKKLLNARRILRKSLLKEAIEGKLTEHLPDDGDARELAREAVIGEVYGETIPFGIPENWVWCRLGDVVKEHVSGGTPEKWRASYWGGNIHWASVKDLRGDILDTTQDMITEEGLLHSTAKLIPAGTIIVCMRMALGKIVINTIDTAINQDLRALFPKDCVEKRYIFYFLKSLEAAIKNKGRGTTVKGIIVRDLMNFLLPLPPLKEQKRIVQKLDAMLEAIDSMP